MRFPMPKVTIEIQAKRLQTVAFYNGFFFRRFALGYVGDFIPNPLTRDFAP